MINLIVLFSIPPFVKDSAWWKSKGVTKVHGMNFADFFHFVRSRMNYSLVLNSHIWANIKVSGPDGYIFWAPSWKSIFLYPIPVVRHYQQVMSYYWQDLKAKMIRTTAKAETTWKLERQESWNDQKTTGKMERSESGQLEWQAPHHFIGGTLLKNLKKAKKISRYCPFKGGHFLETEPAEGGKHQLERNQVESYSTYQLIKSGFRLLLQLNTKSSWVLKLENIWGFSLANIFCYRRYSDLHVLSCACGCNLKRCKRTGRSTKSSKKPAKTAGRKSAVFWPGGNPPIGLQSL